MCGIVGIVDLKNNRICESKLKHMNSLLFHRGPDHSNTLVFNNMGFGHNRLSIIDLDESANQPMKSFNKELTIIYNGEIFNYIELRKDLIKKGYSFKTTSDTEVILASYLEYGKECIEKFNGMWAFAIHDARDNSIFISRDRFGEKPLYYFLDHKYFIFSSEKKAITKSHFYDGNIDSKALATAHKSPFVLESSGFTEFENVNNLLPGHNIHFKKNKIKVSRWWKIKSEYSLENYSEEELTGRFSELLLDSCNLRLRSDVPISATLSGGLDSSAIVSNLNLLTKNYDIYSHKFKDAFLDEFDHAKSVADHLDKKIKIVESSKDDLQKKIDKSIYHLETIYWGVPDSAFRIYENQKNDGFKISIDGHGADELLGGYISHFDHLAKSKKIYQLKDIFNIWTEKEKQQLMPLKLTNFLKFFILSRLNISSNNNNLYSSPYSNEIKNKNFKSQMIGEFQQTMLPKILKNFDALSMANSIEVRMPFLDHRLVEFCFSLNEEYFIRGKWRKYILRKSIEDKVPHNVAWREDKIGFNSPVSEYLSNQLYDWSNDTINSSSNEFYDKKQLSKDLNSIKNNRLQWEKSMLIWTKLNTIKLRELLL